MDEPMPELPEVETVRLGLAPVLEGAIFARVEQRRPDLRFPLPDAFGARLEGRRVESLARRAKYLLASLDDGQVLAMHLGMSGRFLIASPVNGVAGTPQVPGGFAHESGGGDKHDHIIFEMSNLAVIRYNDVRRFGYMMLIAPGEFDGHPHFRDLGIEPLGTGLNAAYLAARGRGRKQSLKGFLLDQHVIAGLGNIYVCEALFRAGLSPAAPAARLAAKNGAPSVAAKRLAPAIGAVLNEAIAAGGSSLRDYRKADGTLGYFQHSFAVYGREGEACPRRGCNATIRRMVQGGRSTFYCGHCQK
jgi:formamidopyrimidine-DNA glycosylase